MGRSSVRVPIRKRPLFRTGDVIETIMGTRSSKYYRYKNIFHPVKVLGYDKKKNQYRLHHFVFEDDAENKYDVASPEELFFPRPPEPIPFMRGKRVQFMSYDRKGLDGDMERVWARGVMVRKDDDTFITVRHVSWDDNADGEYKETRVYANQLREDNVSDEVYSY